MITEKSLAAMRAQQEKTFLTPCVWVKTKPTQAANGRWVEGTPVRQAGSCRIGQMGHSAIEREIAGRMTGRVLYTLTVSFSWDVKPPDRIEAGERIFEVLGVITTTFSTARRAVCAEVV